MRCLRTHTIMVIKEEVIIFHMVHGYAFRGKYRCDECGETSKYGSDVRRKTVTVGQCPDCGGTEVKFTLVEGTMEEVL